MEYPSYSLSQSAATLTLLLFGLCVLQLGIGSTEKGRRSLKCCITVLKTGQSQGTFHCYFTGIIYRVKFESTVLVFLISPPSSSNSVV